MDTKMDALRQTPSPDPHLQARSRAEAAGFALTEDTSAGPEASRGTAAHKSGVRNEDARDGAERGASRLFSAAGDHDGFWFTSGTSPTRHTASRHPARRRLASADRTPLSRTITDEVVPLLVLAHRPPAPLPHTAGLAPEETEAAVARLVELALASDVEAARAFMETLHARGVCLDVLYLEVISGAARRLGELWHDDRASFADVTIGTLALQRLLHELDHGFCCCADRARRDPQRRMLLAPRPGEPHCFALDMLDAFLRRAGWDVVMIAPRTEAELIEAVHDDWFAVLGISDSCESEPEELAAMIHAVRRASQNRHLRVMIGGPAFASDPDRAIRVGADATAADASHAVAQAEGLYALVRNDA